MGDVVHSAKTSWLIGRNTLGNGVETTTFSGSKLILAGTDADNLAEMSVYTRYLNSSSLQNVEISNGTLAFFGGAYDNGAGTEYYGFDLDLQNATVKLSGKTKLQYGYTWNNTIDGVARIGDLVLDCDGIDSEWLIYSSQSICMYINSISSETQGGSGSVLEWKFNNKNVYVQNDAEIAVETFLLYGQLHVLGNYLNGFDGESLMHYQNSGTGNFYVTGTFETKGTFAVCFDAAFTSTKTIMNVGGIVGGTSGSKITTGYNYEAYSNNTGVSIIALRGAGSYSTTTALVDFSAGANPTELALNGALGINKTGEGVQYLRGENMYRGQTTVSAGELYINASGSGNSAGWGIGAVSLEGGKFGAVGASSNIGKVVATDLTWSNSAMIAVDFAADGTSDLISLSGNFLKAEGDAEGQYMFDFSGVFAAEETKYQIMSWESDSTVEFTESDFGYMYNGEENSLDGYFVMENNSLYFVSVPEPAEYAAIFGMLALGLALWRRRK